MVKSWSVRNVSITKELDEWVKDFKAKMLKDQNQPLGYLTVLNILARLGTIVLSHPEKLTEEQKKLINEYIKEVMSYHPPYMKWEWSDKYLQNMVPKILDGSIKEPYEL